MKKAGILSITFVTMLLVSCNADKAMNVKNSGQPEATVLFPKGSRITNDNFTGTAWLQMLVDSDTTYNSSVGSVTFEPGARTKWHYHPGGQILLVTSGKGRYQEQGKPVRELLTGDVVKCLPNVEHWHGAAPDSRFTHVAIGTNTDRGAVVWLQAVSSEEYSGLQ